jgi:hypothetical protein
MIPERVTNVSSSTNDNIGIKVFSANNQIIFNYQPEWEGSEVVIFDCTSRQVDKFFISGGSELTWNNNIEINSGIYFVTIYNKEKLFSEKIFLNHN